MTLMQSAFKSRFKVVDHLLIIQNLLFPVCRDFCLSFTVWSFPNSLERSKVMASMIYLKRKKLMISKLRSCGTLLEVSLSKEICESIDVVRCSKDTIISAVCLDPAPHPSSCTKIRRINSIYSHESLSRQRIPLTRGNLCKSK